MARYVTFPCASRVCFAAFNCDAFDGGERYLRSDYSVDCDAPSHRASQAYAAVRNLRVDTLPRGDGLSLIHI